MGRIFILMAATLRLATADWTVTFFDDFNGPVVNASSWNVAVNYSRQGELELYIPANVFVQNGSLVLRTVAEQCVLDGTTFNVTSGWVDMQGKFAQQQGKWEIHAQLPDPTAQCSWPAHWLLPDARPSCWPIGGEVDIMEQVTGFKKNAVFGTYHWGWQCYQDQWPALNKNGLYPNTSNPAVQPIDFSAGFHTFSVEWNASSITWSVDGVAYWQRAPAADAAHAQWNAEYLPYSPMYLILNTAVGAESWSGCRFDPAAYGTQYHYIDWVRISEWV